VNDNLSYHNSGVFMDDLYNLFGNFLDRNVFLNNLLDKFLVSDDFLGLVDNLSKFYVIF